MKMSEVLIKTDVEELLKSHPLVEVNYKSILSDFNIIYADILDQDHPEEFPEAQLKEIKSNIFSAFCYGVVSATDLKSQFRLNFNLPKEVEKKIANKLILPDSEIKQMPEKKLIL